jgi:uncharacterized protein YcnI
MGLLRTAAFVTALGAAGPAAAHISPIPAEAPAGSYEAIRFRVGHACAGAEATTAVRIEAPAGLPAMRAQPKAGWTVSVERRPGEGGEIQAVTWTGNLPADQFDEFAVFLKLPDVVGEIEFAAIQTCGATETRWDQPPMLGGPTPAPVFRIIPAAPVAGPQHNH